MARLIKANTEQLHNDRDVFYVSMSGFDTHTDDGGVLASKLTQINDALAG